jgi:hypothetical protein
MTLRCDHDTVAGSARGGFRRITTRYREKDSSMIMRRWLAPLAGCAVLVAFAGCSGRGDSGDFARVYGTVTHNGVPVEGARVKFVSTTEVKGQKEEFSTVTDDNGQYAIAGQGKVPGIPPGKYQVVIYKLIAGPGRQGPEELDLVQLEMSGLGQNLLPVGYGAPETSKLTAILEPGKNDNVNFDLKGR